MRKIKHHTNMCYIWHSEVLILKTTYIRKLPNTVQAVLKKIKIVIMYTVYPCEFVHVSINCCTYFPFS